MPTPTEIQSRLRKAHPRLLISKETPSLLRAEIQKNDLARRWYERIQSNAKKMLSAEPSRYEIPDGLRLLGVSRRVLDRTYTLALVYLLDGDKRCVERLWRELDAAASFPDWNPRHFLDTAEMTHAFAIAYDWLYDAWTAEQRARIRAAMMEKGLGPALECYRGKARFGWWVGCHHNWNQVCNGGIGVGALAIADELPDVAGEILPTALQSLKLPMAEFAPDGAWGEGPGYWNYATSYNVLLLAALETALGTDFGLSQTPGFSETGLFPIYVSGPTGESFSFADAHSHVIRAPQMFWLARRFDRPLYAWYEQTNASPHPLDLVWFCERAMDPVALGISLDKYFRKSEVVTMRSAWLDKNAAFIAFKAGDNKFNHSHLDIGTFVLDALGHRWAVDLGSDNYNIPGYFGGKRWTYYRLRAEGHNTLVINPGHEPDQEPKAATRITRFESNPAGAIAIADLTPAYVKHARQVLRGVKMINRRQALMQDEVTTLHPSDLWWFMHTPATVELKDDGREATLTQKDRRLWARILSPKEAKFTVMDAAPLPSTPNPPEQAKNKGVRKLALHLAGVREARITVFFAPLEKGESPPADLPSVPSLANW